MERLMLSVSRKPDGRITGRFNLLVVAANGFFKMRRARCPPIRLPGPPAGTRCTQLLVQRTVFSSVRPSIDFLVDHGVLTIFLLLDLSAATATTYRKVLPDRTDGLVIAFPQ
jgi:hypothetical protein